jgi:peptidyl-tRNA hydrolase, PTH1 family
VVVIAGLGNPGQEYRYTRHNLGFLTIQTLAQRHQISLAKNKFESRFGLGFVSRQKSLLVAPLTFMNRSGSAVLRWLDYYHLTPDNLLVIHDDLDLSWSRLRIVTKGGAGGHKGVFSIIEELQTREFTRVRLGIGRPPEGKPPEAYVLESFPEEEKKQLPQVVTRACEAVEAILENGVLAAMNHFNTAKNC